MNKPQGYPKGWTEFQYLVFDARPRHRVGDIGFRVGPKEVPGFAHRLKLARSFEGINLGGYGNETQLGYEGLFRVILTHSALERFVPLLFKGEERLLGSLTPLLASYDQESVLSAFQVYDPEKLFWDSFYGKCHERLQRQLDKCISGEEVNVSRVSAGIRHIFAHGHLTPNANEAKAKNVRAICDCVSDFLIDFMDEEFYRKVRDYCDVRELSWEELSA